MIKTHCQAIHNGIQCNARIPGTKRHNEKYGNYCESCSGKTGYYHSKKIRETINRTPLETDTIKRLREEAKIAEILQKETEQTADIDYATLSEKVSEEWKMGELEKAQSMKIEIPEEV